MIGNESQSSDVTVEELNQFKISIYEGLFHIKQKMRILYTD